MNIPKNVIWLLVSVIIIPLLMGIGTVIWTSARVVDRIDTISIAIISMQSDLKEGLKQVQADHIDIEVLKARAK